MQSTKRTVEANVKMSAGDSDSLKRAADALSPGAILSNSGIILGLAKIAAKRCAPEQTIQSAAGRPLNEKATVKISTKKDHTHGTGSILKYSNCYMPPPAL
jgi:hypothetical protein